MTQDPSLFPPPRANYTRTSRKAAAQIAPKAGNVRDLVYDAIAAAGERGATNEQIARCTGVWVDTVKPRVHELGQAGLVKALAEHRKSSRGASVLVFVAAFHVRGRPLEDWPRRRISYRERAEAAERRVRELEADLRALKGEP
jgi:hypothetical protein